MTIPIKPLHALLSPSGAEKWWNCPGSILAEKGLPDGSNKYSDEGTCAHAVAALCLTEGEPASEYIGRVIEMPVRNGDPVRTYEFREDMVEPVQLYVDNLRTYAEGNTLDVEVSLPIGHVTGEEGATGTGDGVIFTSDLEEIQVHDLKFGMGVEVSAERNKQLMLYGLGALEKYDLLDTVKRVRLVIHQPRICLRPSEWDCTLEELRAFGVDARAKAKSAQDVYYGRSPDVRTPVEAGCRWCKAKADCPQLAAAVLEATGADAFEVIPEELPKSTDAGSLAVLGAKFRSIGLVESWIKAVRARAESALFEMNNSSEAQAALGIKIVEGKQGNRAWSNAEEVERLFKRFKFRKDEMYSFKLLSPTVMEKRMLKEGLAKGHPTWWPKTQALITRVEGKPSIAPLSDPRPPLDLKPGAEDFDVVPQTEAW